MAFLAYFKGFLAGQSRRTCFDFGALVQEIHDYELSVQQLMHLPKSMTQSQISQDSQDSQYSSAAFEAEHLAAQVQELTEHQQQLEAQVKPFFP